MASCDKYNILRKLGTGGFADVFLAKNRDTGSLCALKVIVKNSDFSEEYEKFIQREIDTMKELKHKHIINLLDASLNAKYCKRTGGEYDVCYLALEVAAGGDMFGYVAQTERFTEDIARYYLHQIVDAFDYMNRKGISHRDMKPDNLLFDSEFNLKISDFGWASTRAKNTTCAGTIQYQAPEIYLEENYSGTCVDIFAIGVILFIMVAQHPPFVRPDPQDRHYNAICLNRDDLFWKWHTKNKENGINFFSNSFRELVSMMLALDPLARPSLAEVRAHEWYNLPIPTHEQIKEEFRQRLDVMSHNSFKEGEDLPKDIAESNGSINNSIFRSTSDNASSDDVVSVDRTIQEYVSEYKTCTHFFSTYNLALLWEALAVCAHKMSKEYKFSDEDYSLQMIVVIDDYKLDLNVTILKFSDEDKYCVDVSKNSGDTLIFNKVYNQILGFFGGYANAHEFS